MYFVYFSKHYLFTHTLAYAVNPLIVMWMFHSKAVENKIVYYKWCSVRIEMFAAATSDMSI